MKLYIGSNTCAIGIQILLEECAVPYQIEKVDVSGGATRTPAFLSINPKGKVPTLVRDDGSVLTEFSAIATWIARTFPQNNLLGIGVEAETRAVEVLAYVEGTVHGQGFARVFAPQFFEPQDMFHGQVGLGREKVREQGRAIAQSGFEMLDPQLAQHQFAAGDNYTIADAALFYVEKWALPNGVVLPSNVSAHFDRMRARAAVQRVLGMWSK